MGTHTTRFGRRRPRLSSYANDSSPFTTDCLLLITTDELEPEEAQDYVVLASTDCMSWRDATDLGYIAEQYTKSALSNPFVEDRNPELFDGFELRRRQVPVDAIVAALRRRH